MKKIYAFLRRHASAIVFALPIAAIVFIFRHEIFGPNFTANGDVIYNFFEYFNYKAQGGNIVTQSILSGFPVPVSVTGVWFYPINRLALAIFNPYNAYKFLNIFNILLTYVLTYAYARKIKLSHLLAVLAALVFTTSGQLMLWADTLTNTNYYFLLPLALICVEYLFASATLVGGLLWTLALGAVLGTGWLSGHIQYIAYIHAFVLVYSLFAFRRNGANFLRSGSALLIALMVSYLVGKSQILAILIHRSISARQNGVSLNDFFGPSYMPQDIIHYFLPFYKLAGVPFTNANLYIGILPLVALGLAFVFRRRISGGHFKFYFWSLVFFVLASIKYSPVGLILHKLPFFDSFREAPRIMYLGNFAAAFVVAYAAGYLVENREHFDYSRFNKWLKLFGFWFVAPVVVLASILYGFFAKAIAQKGFAYFMAHKYSSTAKLPPEHYHSLIQNYVGEALGQFSIFDAGVVMLVLSLVFLRWLVSHWKTLSPKAILCLVTAFATLNIAVVYANYYKAMPIAELERVPRTAAFIKAHTVNGQEFRYFSVLPGFTIFDESTNCEMSDADKLLLQKELLQPNINMLYGLDALDGYDNFMPRPISELLAYAGSEQSVTGNLLANEPLPIEGRVKKIVERKNVLRMMNVRYLVSAYPINDPDFKKVFEEPVGSCATMVSIYELSSWWPRYFLTGWTYPYANFDQFVNTVLPVPSIVGKDLATSSPTLWKSVTPTYGYDTTTFNLDEKSRALLYVGNAWLPNYQAFIDGSSTDMFDANHAYFFLPVPAGKHEIKIEYRH